MMISAEDGTYGDAVTAMPYQSVIYVDKDLSNLEVHGHAGVAVTFWGIRAEPV